MLCAGQASVSHHWVVASDLSAMFLVLKNCTCLPMCVCIQAHPYAMMTWKSRFSPWRSGAPAGSVCAFTHKAVLPALCFVNGVFTYAPLSSGRTYSKTVSLPEPNYNPSKKQSQSQRVLRGDMARRPHLHHDLSLKRPGHRLFLSALPTLFNLPTMNSSIFKPTPI